MKTLFIDRKNAELEVDRGRLIIRLDAIRPHTSIPVSNIDMLVVSASVQFSSTLLNALTQAGITSVFINPRQTDSSPDAPPRSCLVIDATKLEHLVMDGPALSLRLQNQSRRLFPLRRLARIHVMGQIQCGFDALLHCAEQQIPVAFFNLQGKLRCQLYYPVFENSVLAHWLEHVEFDEQAKNIYNEWLSLQRLHILGKMGCRSGASESRLHQTEAHLHTLFNKHWGHRQLLVAREWLSGMLAAHLSQLIVQHGLANQSRGKRRLLEDMLPTCEIWLLYLLAVSVIEHRKAYAVDAFGMSFFYQKHADEIDYMAQRMLSQLTSRFEAII